MTFGKTLRSVGLALAAMFALAGCPNTSSPLNGWGYELFASNEGHRIVQLPDAGYFVSGTAWVGDESSQEIIVVLDAAGQVQHQQIFSAVYSQAVPGPKATAMMTLDGSVYVVGLTKPEITDYLGNGRLRVVKTDQAGNTLWDNTYGGEERWKPRAIMDAHDGCLAIAAEVDTLGNRPEKVIKLDSDGSVMWASTIPDTYPFYVVLNAITMPGSGFLAVGYDYSDDADAALWALDTDGNTLWYHRYDRPGLHEGWTVAPAPDGGFYVGGRYTLSSGKDRVYLLKTDADGVFEWDKEDVYVPGDAGDDVQIWDMVVDDEGYLAIVGDERTVNYIPGFPVPVVKQNSFVMRLDATGALQWKTNLEGATYGIDYTQQGTYITSGYADTGQHQYLRVVELDKTGRVVN